MMYHVVLNRLKLHQKRTHYKELFKKIGKNSKLLWNMVNCLIKKEVNKMAVTELFYKDNLLTDSVNICGAFNDHFANAGKNVQQSIGQLPPLDDILRYVKQVNSYFKFSQVTEGQLCKIVNNLKLKHSSGNDGISNLLLKQLMPVIKGPLCLVLNHSLVVGVFPDLMKCAKILPLHKTDKATNPDNYRPVSL